MNTGITGRQMKVFQCPACKEYINTSMRECRFCGALVDYKTALASAIVREKIDEACDLADTIGRVVWFMPVVFWAAGVWVYTSWKHLWLIPLGWVLLPLISLAGLMTLWFKLRAIHAEDPDLERAKRRLRVWLWGWVLTFPVPLIVIFLARVSIWK